MKRMLLIIVASGANALSLSMQPADAAELPPALLECARETDDARRLACYDEQVDPTGELRRLPSMAENEEPANAQRQPEADTKPDTDVPAEIDEFGRTGELARQDRPTPPDSITAIITRIEEQPRGERIVHLDNGQVWKELNRNRLMRIKEGDQITIESGMFDSYRLVGPGNRLTRAKRIK